MVSPTGALTTVVVGGGIAGLAAARRLADDGEQQIIVCDAAPRFGGKLHRLRLDGPRHDHAGHDQPHHDQPHHDQSAIDPAGPGEPFTVDVGAESMLARRPEAVELISELGLEERRVHPTGAKAQAYVDGRVTALPPSNMGVPTDLDALSGYLTVAGLQRARREPELSAPSLSGDVAIGEYVAERFGDEVTDRVLEPMLGGVYAGQSRKLSFAAVHPALFAAARDGGSLLQAAQLVSAAARRTNDHGPSSAPPVFAGLSGGIAAVVTALQDDLERRGVALRRSTTVREIRRDGSRYRLTVGPVPAPEMIMADRVVLATPAAPTARLLSELAPDASSALREIGYASMAVVTLVLGDAALTGSGLLIPPGELPTIKAFTYSSNKWSWIAERAAQVFGPGTAVVRASVGRFGEEHLLQVSDDELVRRTFDEARVLPGWDAARLLRFRVQRWGGGLPQYPVGHRERVHTIRDSVATVGNLAVAGAYLDGVGLPACIASAYRAVESL
jgi:oxygen-dependent protoporphyrinogen oxidase